jgi:cytochrome c-type biogenesis protein CcmH
MGQFTLFASILVCLAIAFAISAIWQKSRGLAIALALAIPLAAGALYWTKGEPRATDATLTKAPETLEEAVGQLEKLTAADPKNFGDLVMLARTYMATNQLEKGRDTYKRALALKPDETSLYVDYVEAVVRSAPDHRFTPEAVSMLEKVLKAEPENQRALFYYGVHQRQSGDPKGAVATWEKLLGLIDASASTTLRKEIASARADAGMPAAEEAPAITVKVTIDPTLAASLKPEAVLFVYARAAGAENGPPIAVRRLQPDNYPVEVTLGDADSPMPTAKLFSQKEAILLARLSMSGTAAPSEGDLEADPVVIDVKPGAHAELTLNRGVQ